MSGEKNTTDTPYRDADWLTHEYWTKGRSTADIAATCDVSATTIRTWMDKHGIDRRQSADNPPYHDPDRLRTLYWDDELSLREIADKYGVSKRTILTHFQKHNIDRRPPNPTPAKQVYRDADWLRREYQDNGRTLRELANECGVDKDTIRRWLARHEIPIRPPNCHGHGVSCHITSNGYHRLSVGDYTIGIHQLLALLKGAPPELVFGTDALACHHANGLPLDNRLCNIQPMDWESHSRLHADSPETSPAEVNAYCPLPEPAPDVPDADVDDEPVATADGSSALQQPATDD